MVKRKLSMDEILTKYLNLYNKKMDSVDVNSLSEEELQEIDEDIINHYRELIAKAIHKNLGYKVSLNNIEMSIDEDGNSRFIVLRLD